MDDRPAVAPRDPVPLGALPPFLLLVLPDLLAAKLRAGPGRANGSDLSNVATGPVLGDAGFLCQCDGDGASVAEPVHSQLRHRAVSDVDRVHDHVSR